MPDKPDETDWKAVAQLALQQRDRAEQRASNMELNLELSQQREANLRTENAALVARVAELVSTE